MAGSNYLDFDKAQGKAMKLIRTGENPTFGLLVITGINLGLRIGDLLTLTYEDLRGESIVIRERKTKKKRQLQVNHNIKQAMSYFEDAHGPFKAFRSQKGSVYSPQHVNRLLKKHFKGPKISTHSLRKTFGRRVWESHNHSEKSLVYLNEIFNHTSMTTTKKYLGIQQEELNDIYHSL